MLLVKRYKCIDIIVLENAKQSHSASYSNSNVFISMDFICGSAFYDKVYPAV